MLNRSTVYFFSTRALPLILVVGYYGILTGLFFVHIDYFLCFLFFTNLVTVVFYFKYSIIGYNLIIKNDRVNWKDCYEDKKKKIQSNDTKSEFVEWKDCMTYVIIPNYKEPIKVLVATVNQLAKSNIAKTHIVVVFGMEGREEGHVTKAEALIKMFKPLFLDVIYTVHFLQDDETPGKGSNENFACRQLKTHFTENNYKEDCILVTCIDADICVHPNYFDAVLYRFCFSSDRYMRTWKPPTIQAMNDHKVSFILRNMIYAFNSQSLAEVHSSGILSENLPNGIFTMPYNTIKKVNYFDPNFVTDDYHMYIKTVVQLGERYHAESIPLSCYFYSTGEGASIFSAIKERFNQAKRHMLSLQEIVYLTRKSLDMLFDKSARTLSFGRWFKLFTATSIFHYQSIVGFTVPFFVGFVLPILNLSPALRDELQGSPWFFLLIFLQVISYIFSLAMNFYVSKMKIFSYNHLNEKKISKKRLEFDFKSFLLFLRIQIVFSATSFITFFLFGWLPGAISLWKVMKDEKHDFHHIGTKTSLLCNTSSFDKLSSSDEKEVKIEKKSQEV